MKNTKVLNPKQQEAILHDKGPLLIIAGAGTGKTTVVTQRIKHLILEKNVKPSQILTLTFTEKAALEMEERIDVAMPYGYSQMWTLTFHSFCDRILRNEAVHIGLNPSYKLMTEAETILFLRQNIFKFKLDYFRPLGNPNKFLEGLIQHFSRLRDEDISPSDYHAYAKEGGKRKGENGKKNTLYPFTLSKTEGSPFTLHPDDAEAAKTMELSHAFTTYQELKDKEGLMDYADLITNVLRLFRQRANVLKQYQEQFEYILVDEFQDTNFAQNQLAILLAGAKRNITVVGDDDQAIYRWRGAAISNMIQFRKTYHDAKIVTLTQNYRSTQEILDRSYQLITNNNPDRLETQEKIDKKLTATRKEKEHGIELLYEDRVEDEAECVTQKIMELMKKEKREHKDFAILVRANDHAQPFSRALQRHNIHYQFLGPGRLFKQEEIKDLIAYLKVLYNFEDSISLYRVLTFSLFQLEARDIAALLNYAKRKNLSLFQALERTIEKPPDQQELFIKNKSFEKLEKVFLMIKKHLKRVSTDSAGQILYYFLQDSGLLKKFLTPQNEEETKQYQNIAKFFDKLKSFEAEHEDARIFPVVDWIDLSMQMGESPLASDIDWSENNSVNILTIHSSKGLEFPVVFLVNLVSQRFPTRERLEQIPIPQELIKEILPTGDYHLQEERRLFYVGMTRARDHLYFTAAKFYGEGKRDRKLSPFVYEALGEKTIDKQVEQQKIQSTAVQTSLLEWVEKIQTPKTVNSLITNYQLPITKLTYISYSQLQCFDMCPLHYKLQYVLKVPYQMTPPLSFGVSVHSALKDYYHAWMQENKSEDIEVLLKKKWIDEGYSSKEHQKEAFERAQFILKEYIKENFKPDGTKPLAVEIPFQFVLNLPKRPPLKLAGRIDRVDKLDGNKIEIIDYKTGTNIPDEKELAKNLQLTLYALAATKVHDDIFGKKPEEVVLSLHYLEKGGKLTTFRTQEQLEAAETEILQKIEEIENSDLTCSKGALCQNCEYKMLCSGL